MSSGMRERKKQLARQHISDVATELFLAQGFEAVTITDISVAADYSKATVFNYFPRKEDMVLDMRPEAERLLTEAIRERLPHQSVAEAARALLHRLVAEEHQLLNLKPPMADFGRVIAESPALTARAREHRDELAACVAALLVAEGQAPLPAMLTGDLLLATITAAVITPITRVIAGEDPAAVAVDQPRLIDEAFDLLTDGMRVVGVNRPEDGHQSH